MVGNTLFITSAFGALMVYIVCIDNRMYFVGSLFDLLC